MRKENRGESMKKMLLVLLTVGILMLGTLSVLQQICEESDHEHLEFSCSVENWNLENRDSGTNGGGSGNPPAPG